MFRIVLVIVIYGPEFSVIILREFFSHGNTPFDKKCLEQTLGKLENTFGTWLHASSS